MKQKLIALLLAAAMALPAAGCGVSLDAAGGMNVPADIPTDTYDGDSPAPQEQDHAVSGSQDGPLSAAPPEESVQPDGYTGQEDGPLYTAGEDGLPDEDGTYNSAEDVALYLDCYGHLPDNYITKTEARELGWTGGSVEQVAPGCAIGGDRFGNREGILPGDRTYYECDIDTIGRSSRGAKRLVFSDDGLIYYTEDHYESFILLSGEE